MNILIDKGWRLRVTPPGATAPVEIPAQVPGNVMGDLQRAEIIPDPYFGCNSADLRPWEYVDWEYVTQVTIPEYPANEPLELCFNGIDTLATIYFDDEQIGESDNMFMVQRFALPKCAVGSTHTLRVKIRSALLAAMRYPYPPQIDAEVYNYEALYLRRARHTFGWDIFPRIVGAGLWRPVELRSVPQWRWEHTYLHTFKLEENLARLVLHWKFALPQGERLEGLRAVLTMELDGQKHTLEFTPNFIAGRNYINVPSPQLWWPMGSGKQPLYNCRLELQRDGQVLTTSQWHTGIRTVKLDRTETVQEENARFRFVVNGKPIFIHGSNWVPVTAMHGENEPALVKRAVAMWSELNCNMLRIWGGGVYEDPLLYEECDRRGILIWQDFMVACEHAPLDEEYLNRISVEARQVIQRLRQHASLALWSGDNECDSMMYWHAKITGRCKPSYNRLTREIFPRILDQEDPYRDYLPSSPYISDILWDNGLGDTGAPEQHLWGPRDYWKSKFYFKHKAKFASEMGYHGMPSRESLEKFIPADQLDGSRVDNPYWLIHAAQPYGDIKGPYAYRIALMETQIKEAFGALPANTDEFIQASQFCQGEGFKFFIEFFRMRKPDTGGLIWWNIIDGWPQISDAVVDFYGNRKLAWHFIKCSQQPVLLACNEPTNAGKLPVMAMNNSTQPVRGSYEVHTVEGKSLVSGHYTLAADADSQMLAEIPLDAMNNQEMLIITWKIDGEETTHANHYLYGPNPFSLGQYRQWWDVVKKEVYGL